MPFSPGDFVEVRSWYDLLEEFGVGYQIVGEEVSIATWPVFTPSMRKYCGKTLEVVRCFGAFDAHYYVLRDGTEKINSCCMWNFPEAALVPASSSDEFDGAGFLGLLMPDEQK